MSELPPPLVPPEVDLQDFPFMPLQVARLRDSNLAAEEEPEACWYAVLLWAASWHQIPAGSLPDNDTVLMRLVGLGRDQRTWKKHRAGALRGFVLCSDGRFYHPVVAESALEAWDGKLRQRHRTFCAAVRKHNERKPEEKLVSPTFEEWDDLGRPERVTETASALSRVTAENVARDIGSKRKGQGKGQGQGDLLEEPNGSSPPSPPTHLRGQDWPEIPDWVPVEPWNGFIAMRRRKGANPTPRAVELLIKHLGELDQAGAPPGRVLDQSTRKNWTDLYPLKDDAHGNGKHSPRDHRDGFTQAIDRRLGLGADGRPAAAPG